MSHLVVLRRPRTDVGFDLLTPNGFDRENGRERESTLTLFRAELPESGLKRVELLGIRRANKAVLGFTMWTEIGMPLMWLKVKEAPT